MITVWSEEEPSGLMFDCVYSAGLMALDYGGWHNYPRGHHTIAERNALEKTQTMFARNTGSDFEAFDEASIKRYGVRLRTVRGTLEDALRRTGTVLALGGRNGRLPRTDAWRRWDRDFVGSHAVAVVPLGNDTCLVLDPLADMGFVGDTVPITKVLKWANGPEPRHARTARLNEFGSAGGNTGEEDTVTEVTITLFPEGQRTCTIPAGGRVEGWDLNGLKESRDWPTGSSFPADGTVVIRQTPKKAPNGTFLRCTAGVYARLYVPITHAALGAPLNPPVDRSALKAELAETKAALKAAQDRIKALEANPVQ